MPNHQFSTTTTIADSYWSNIDISNMGSNFSLRICQFINDVHVAMGGGVLGVLVYIYNGMNTSTFKFISIGGLTAACLLYGFSGSETVSVTSEKVIVISGCDSGLGYSLAQHACELGFTVLAGCLNLNSEGAVKLGKKFNKKMVFLELDLTDDESIANAVDQVEVFLAVNEPCELWALVNNAGVMVFGEFEWQTERLIKQQLDINVYGTMALTKGFMPLLRQYSGRVITISSHCAQATLPGLSVYGAAKSALAAWSDGLRVETKKYGVSVINFIPGSFVQQSNIMARQNENVYEMQSAMTEEQFTFYGDYFKSYNTYLSALSGAKTPKKIEDDDLYNIFEQTLLDKYPNATYIHESWKYKFFHMLFKVSPWRIRDGLVSYFVQMPKWRQENRVSRITNVIG